MVRPVIKEALHTVQERALRRPVAPLPSSQSTGINVQLPRRFFLCEPNGRPLPNDSFTQAPRLRQRVVTQEFGLLEVADRTGLPQC